MSNAELNKLTDVVTDVVDKMIEENEKRAKKESAFEKGTEKETEKQTEKETEIDLEKEVEEQTNDMNEFIDNEVLNENDTTTYLTKEELEGVLNDHFKRIEDVLHDYENQNIDADTFKDKLKDLTNHVKNNARTMFNKVKHKTTKPIRDLKTYSRNKIDGFMNKTNAKLKEISNKIDQKQTEKEVSHNTEKEKSLEDKIEQTLRNDPELFKQTLAVTQINAMRNHLDESKINLEKLNEMNHDDPTQQYKINDMKLQLGNHIDGMEKELKNLEQSHNPEKTMENLNEQTQEQEEERKEEKEFSKEKKPAKEEVLER